jgi:arsenate reductase (glutaredoxin)
MPRGVVPRGTFLAGQAVVSSRREQMEVQIFGFRNSPDTRAAIRFFAERRVRTHFVDLDRRAASPGELRRFLQRFGTGALLDRDGPRFRQLGLAHASHGEARWLELLAGEPRLLRVPLVRAGHRLSIGCAEAEWKDWLAS